MSAGNTPGSLLDKLLSDAREIVSKPELGQDLRGLIMLVAVCMVFVVLLAAINAVHRIACRLPFGRRRTRARNAHGPATPARPGPRAARPVDRAPHAPSSPAATGQPYDQAEEDPQTSSATSVVSTVAERRLLALSYLRAFTERNLHDMAALTGTVCTQELLDGMTWTADVLMQSLAIMRDVEPDVVRDEQLHTARVAAGLAIADPE